MKNTHYIFDIEKNIDSNIKNFDDSVKEWANRLKEHVHNELGKVPDYMNVIKMLIKCEKLNLDELDLEDVYIRTIANIINCE